MKAILLSRVALSASTAGREPILSIKHPSDFPFDMFLYSKRRPGFFHEAPCHALLLIEQGSFSGICRVVDSLFVFFRRYQRRGDDEVVLS